MSILDSQLGMGFVHGLSQLLHSTDDKREQKSIQQHLSQAFDILENLGGNGRAPRGRTGNTLEPQMPRGRAGRPGSGLRDINNRLDDLNRRMERTTRDPGHGRPRSPGRPTQRIQKSRNNWRRIGRGLVRVLTRR